MRAMVFDGSGPVLREMNLPDPVAGPGQLLIDVHACGVCRTDLHLVDGELPDPKRPGWCAMARPHVRSLPVLPFGSRKPLRLPGFYRLHA